MDDVNDGRQKTAAFIEGVRSRQYKRSVLFGQYDDHIVKLKSSKDLNVFQVNNFRPFVSMRFFLSDHYLLPIS